MVGLSHAICNSQSHIQWYFNCVSYLQDIWSCSINRVLIFTLENYFFPRAHLAGFTFWCNNISYTNLGKKLEKQSIHKNDLRNLLGWKPFSPCWDHFVYFLKRLICKLYPRGKLQTEHSEHQMSMFSLFVEQGLAVPCEDHAVSQDRRFWSRSPWLSMAGTGSGLGQWPLLLL